MNTGATPNMPIACRDISMETRNGYSLLGEWRHVRNQPPWTGSNTPQTIERRPGYHKDGATSNMTSYCLQRYNHAGDAEWLFFAWRVVRNMLYPRASPCQMHLKGGLQGQFSWHCHASLKAKGMLPLRCQSGFPEHCDDSVLIRKRTASMPQPLQSDGSGEPLQDGCRTLLCACSWWIGEDSKMGASSVSVDFWEHWLSDWDRLIFIQYGYRSYLSEQSLPLSTMCSGWGVPPALRGYFYVRVEGPDSMPPVFSMVLRTAWWFTV